MVSPRLHVFLSIGLVICFSNISWSQNSVNSDSSDYQRHLELFDAAVGIENTGIINGPKYNPPINVSGSHPFYHSSTGTTGSVTFRGMPYYNLTLLYDIYSDQLVVQRHSVSGLPDWVMLNTGGVESFMIHEHTFKKYHGSKAQTLGLVGGYYDVLFEGPAFTVIARRKKATKVDLGRVVYENEDRYLFIRNGKKAVPFRGMKNFYDVLDDKDLKAELRAFAKEKGLKVSRSDYDLTTASVQCDAIFRKQK